MMTAYLVIQALFWAFVLVVIQYAREDELRRKVAAEIEVAVKPIFVIGALQLALTAGVYYAIR